MKLTKNEKEILMHRIESADCIAEALTDHCEGDEPASSFSINAITSRCEEMEHDGLESVDLSSRLDADIMGDCCDGCTFFGNMEDAVDFEEITRQKATAYYAAAEALSRKVGVEVATS